MKLLTGLLASTLLLAGAGASYAEVRIAGDQGGQIGRYVDRYEQLRASGQTIIIDGLCASACTIILATIPHDKICVTPNANLAFHAAWVNFDRISPSAPCPDYPASDRTADIPDQQLRAMRHQREADAGEDDSTPAATPASMGPPACSQPVPCRKLR
jgi:hypothetical protein